MRDKKDNARPAGGPVGANITGRQEDAQRNSGRRLVQVATIRTRGGRRHVRFFRGRSGWLVFVSSKSGLILVGGFFKLKKLAIAAAKRLAETGLPPQPEERSHRDIGGRYVNRSL